MRNSNRFALYVLAALCSLGVRAADPEAGEVKMRLRAQGLVPMSKPPPECRDPDSALPIYWVSGDIRNPLVSTRRVDAATASRQGLRGRRFEYASENRGEFGGKLSAREGKQQPRVLLEANIIDLVPLGPHLLVFSGLAHLSMSSGSVHVVEDYDSAPKIEILARLPDKPDVIAMEPKTRQIVMVSELSVSEIWGGYFKVLTTRTHRFPRSTSAVVSWPNILIGHCGGVALLELPWKRNLPPSRDGDDEQLTVVTYWTRPR